MTAAKSYSAKQQGRRNSVRLKEKMWKPKVQLAQRRAMDRASTPLSDDELIAQAIAAGKVSRLPPGVADGAAHAAYKGDWR